jgi:hypothetical protein
VSCFGTASYENIANKVFFLFQQLAVAGTTYYVALLGEDIPCSYCYPAVFTKTWYLAIS